MQSTCSPLGVGSSQIPPGSGSRSWRGLSGEQSYHLGDHKVIILVIK